MAKLSVQAGTTSFSVNIFIQNSSSTTGAGLTGFATAGGSLLSGMICYYSFSGTNAASVAQTLSVPATVGAAFSAGQIVEIDATHMPGVARLDIPNGALASGKGQSVTIMISGGTNVAPVLLEIELTAWNNQDGVHGGMTALPNAAAGAAGGLWILGANAAATTTLTGVAAAGATPATAALSFTGGAASTSSGGTAAAGLTSLGGAGAATTNGAAAGVAYTAGGTTTVSGNDGIVYTGTGNGNGATYAHAGSGKDLNAQTTNALQVNATAINAVSTSSVTTVSAVIGTTQAITFDGNNLPICDVGDWLGHAVTVDANNAPNVSAKYWAGTAITATSIPVATAAGAAGGLFIAGSNAATTISGLTLSGANAVTSTPATAGLTITGGAASTTGGGTSAPGVSVTGGAGAASTNGAAAGAAFAGGGTTTVSGASGATFTSTGNTAGVSISGAGSGDGLDVFGGATGRGVLFKGGATSGDGLQCVANGGGQGLTVLGVGAHHGASFTSGSGATGDGATFVAVSTNGNGATFTHNGTGKDLNAQTTNALQVNATAINAVSTSSVTTISANLGTTQAIAFDGNNLPKVDLEDIRGMASLGAAGYVGIDWGNINDPSAAVDLSFTTISGLDTTANVNVVSWQGVSPSALVHGFVQACTPIRSGTAQAGGASTITLDAGASATNNLYVNEIVYILSGTGAGQVNTVSSYVGSTKVATMVATWATNPDNTSVFILLPQGPISATVSGNVTVGGYAAGQDPATLVLGATAATWNTAGTIGAKINAAGGAADPWATALPGSYGAGTAGFIIGNNLDTNVGSRLATSGYTAPANATIEAAIAALGSPMQAGATVSANIVQVNSHNVTGAGTSGAPWGPA